MKWLEKGREKVYNKVKKIFLKNIQKRIHGMELLQDQHMMLIA